MKLIANVSAMHHDFYLHDPLTPNSRDHDFCLQYPLTQNSLAPAHSCLFARAHSQACTHTFADSPPQPLHTSIACWFACSLLPHSPIHFSLSHAHTATLAPPPSPPPSPDTRVTSAPIHAERRHAERGKGQCQLCSCSSSSRIVSSEGYPATRGLRDQQQEAAAIFQLDLPVVIVNWMGDRSCNAHQYPTWHRSLLAAGQNKRSSNVIILYEKGVHSDGQQFFQHLGTPTYGASDRHVSAALCAAWCAYWAILLA